MSRFLFGSRGKRELVVAAACCVSLWVFASGVVWAQAAKSVGEKPRLVNVTPEQERASKIRKFFAKCDLTIGPRFVYSIHPDKLVLYRAQGNKVIDLRYKEVIVKSWFSGGESFLDQVVRNSLVKVCTKGDRVIIYLYGGEEVPGDE